MMEMVKKEKGKIFICQDHNVEIETRENWLLKDRTFVPSDI